MFLVKIEFLILFFSPWHPCPFLMASESGQYLRIKSFQVAHLLKEIPLEALRNKRGNGTSPFIEDLPTTIVIYVYLCDLNST